MVQEHKKISNFPFRRNQSFLISSVALAQKPLGTIEPFGGYAPRGEHGGEITLTQIFSNIFGVLTIVGGLMFAIYFLLGALNWITSSGQPDKVQKAQNKMISAAIGFIAVVAAYGITFIVGKILGVEILNPADYLIHFWD